MCTQRCHALILWRSQQGRRPDALLTRLAQSSVRVDKGHGVPGRTMAEWLVEAGFDAARVRDSSSAARRDEPVTASERPSRRHNVHSGMGRPNHRCASVFMTIGSSSFTCSAPGGSVMKPWPDSHPYQLHTDSHTAVTT